MPMFVALLPLVAGIGLFEYVALPLWLSVGAMSLSLVMTLLTMRRRVVWLYAFVAVLLFGYLMAQLHHRDVAMPESTPVDMVVEVVGEPSLRDGYRVAEGRIESWSDGKVSHDADYAVQLWIRSDTVCRGDRLHLFSELIPRISRYEGYDRLLHRRGFVGGVSVADYNIMSLERYAPSTLQARAVSKIRRAIPDSVAAATVEAMVAGSRSGIPQQLRDSYSRTGLAHLMALSGLHLGIVVLIANVLLLPLLLLHRGHVLRNMLVVVVLWMFVLLGGGSPSLVRAAIMFTLLQLALAGSRNYNSVNVLSVAIFAMLVYSPNYLYDISFQLSVVAVMGIATWALPVLQRMDSRFAIERWVKTTIVIGVVATLWTMPLVSHTFGIVPIIGVVVTPLLLVTAYLVVGCGLLMLLLPDVVGFVFASGAWWAATLQNDMVAAAASYPWVAIDYRLSGGGVVLCYLIYFVITMLVWSYDGRRAYDTWRV